MYLGWPNGWVARTRSGLTTTTKLPPAPGSFVKAGGIVLPICLVDMEAVLILGRFLIWASRPMSKLCRDWNEKVYSPRVVEVPGMNFKHPFVSCTVQVVWPFVWVYLYNSKCRHINEKTQMDVEVTLHHRPESLKHIAFHSPQDYLPSDRNSEFCWSSFFQPLTSVVGGRMIEFPEQEVFWDYIASARPSGAHEPWYFPVAGENEAKKESWILWPGVELWEDILHVRSETLRHKNTGKKNLSICEQV